MRLPRRSAIDLMVEFNATMIAFDTGGVVPAVSFWPTSTRSNPASLATIAVPGICRAMSTVFPCSKGML